MALTKFIEPWWLAWSSGSTSPDAGSGLGACVLLAFRLRRGMTRSKYYMPRGMEDVPARFGFLNRGLESMGAEAGEGLPKLYGSMDGVAQASHDRADGTRFA